jgi:hypothetical protein
MVFLVEVNNRYGTNLNELCIKNTTPHVGRWDGHPHDAKRRRLAHAAIGGIARVLFDANKLVLDKMIQSDWCVCLLLVCLLLQDLVQS